MNNWSDFGLGITGNLIAAALAAIAAATWRPTRQAPRQLWRFLKLHRSLSSIGMTSFVRTRSDYGAQGRGFCDYIRRAQVDLTLVSVCLPSGEPFHGLTDVIRELIEERSPPVKVRVSLLDPKNEHLMEAFAPMLRKTAEDLATEIKQTLERLRLFRKELSLGGQNLFQIRVHNVIPFGSAIIIDNGTPRGRIQVETKPYKAPYEHSWGFELGSHASHTMYQTLVDSYEAVIADGFCSATEE